MKTRNINTSWTICQLISCEKKQHRRQTSYIQQSWPQKLYCTLMSDFPVCDVVGSRHEDESEYVEAEKCYERALEILPTSQEAKESIRYVQYKQVRHSCSLHSARGHQWCGIFQYYWWTASIKPRLLFSHAGYASWGLSLFSVY